MRVAAQPLFLRGADPHAQGNSKCSAQLAAGPSVNRVSCPGFFLGSRKLTGFGYILLVCTRIPTEIPCFRVLIVLYLEIM